MLDLDEMARATGSTRAEVEAGIREAITAGLLSVAALDDETVTLQGTFPDDDRKAS